MASLFCLVPQSYSTIGLYQATFSYFCCHLVSGGVPQNFAGFCNFRLQVTFCVYPCSVVDSNAAFEPSCALSISRSSPGIYPRSSAIRAPSVVHAQSSPNSRKFLVQRNLLRKPHSRVNRLVLTTSRAHQSRTRRRYDGYTITQRVEAPLRTLRTEETRRIFPKKL